MGGATTYERQMLRMRNTCLAALMRNGERIVETLRIYGRYLVLVTRTLKVLPVLLST